jgi:eukaryotic-like serine/threonine-protein kinase
LAGFVAVVVWFGHEIRDFLAPPVDAITVPSFVGETASDAIAGAHGMNLSAAVIDHGISDRYPKGVVMVQQPQAGASVRAGRQVSFVVSDGMVAHLMPDLRYQSMREVDMDLSRARLQLGTITYVKNDIVPANHVIDQDPAPLANVTEGDKVNLTLSKGGSSTVRVPNLVGMSIDDARTAAEKAGVTLGQLVWTPLGPNGPAHGAVARQSIPPGMKITPFQALSLQVSAGPNESGYVLRQVRVLASIPIPQGATAGDSVKVDLRVRDATGSYDAYRAFAQPGQKIDFTITALGTSVVDLYVNDVLVGETRLGNEPAAVYDQKPSPSPSPGG